MLEHPQLCPQMLPSILWRMRHVFGHICSFQPGSPGVPAASSRGLGVLAPVGTSLASVMLTMTLGGALGHYLCLQCWP